MRITPSDRRRRGGRFLALCLLISSGPTLLPAATPSFRKLQLSEMFFCEGSAFGDLNRDGQLDAIAGPYWYEGPAFTRRHEIYAPVPFDPLQSSENFFAFTHDFNGDGWLDVLVVGFPGTDASWFENPGPRQQPWRRHLAFQPADNESPAFGDLLGSGQPVLVCSAGGRLGYAQPNPREPERVWTFHPISPPGPWQQFTHGLGFGDVNGDGRPDFLTADGWREQPASLAGDPIWTHHPFAFAGAGGAAQIFAYDISGDGLADVVAARNAHGYGLWWYEQVRDANGAINFRPHPITSEQREEKLNGVQFSQLHALALGDLDGDGLNDLITGKRWWAHGPNGDADPGGTPVLYGFLLRRAPGQPAGFQPHLIDDASGIGTQVIARDINGDNLADVISANKRGTFLFLSNGPSSPSTSAATRLTNFSLRSRAGSGEETPIVGFVIAGEGSKQMLLRGIGPALSQFGVAAPLPDPRLILFQNAGVRHQNDNWADDGLADEARRIGAFALAGNSRDAAAITALSAGAYTLHLGGGGTGDWVALTEGYDLDPAPASLTTARVVNYSARAAVGSGDTTLMVGFVIGGESRMRVLVRVAGPALTTLGLLGAVANPALAVFRQNAEIATNDNWNFADTELLEAHRTTGAFSFTPGSPDAALLLTVEPGSYSVHVRAAGSTGIALMEVYEVP